MTAPDPRPLRVHRLLGGVSRASWWRSLRSAAFWQLLLAASGWITMLGTLVLPPGSPPRMLLVFGFVMACPGFAVSGLLPAREGAERWVLAIALSASFAILITVGFTMLRIDSVQLRLGLLSVITTVAVIADVYRSSRSAPAEGGPQ